MIGWLGDSRHWVEFAENQNDQVVEGLLIRDALKPRVCKNVPIRSSAFHEDMPFVTSDNHYLVNTWAAKIGIISHVDVYEVDLDHPNIPPRKYPISLPPKSEINDIVCSPSGDRIAWLLTTGPAFATGDYAREKAGLEARTSMWASRLDGSGMREVGSVLNSPDAPWYDVPNTLQWLPGGRFLSFLYRAALWTVPAE